MKLDHRKAVRVFHDPVTMQNFEGSAIVTKIQFTNDGQSYCSVRFLAGDDPRKADRWVDNEQLRAVGFKVKES